MTAHRAPACSLAILQDGRSPSIQAMSDALARRICRTAQFLGVREAVLPADEDCSAELRAIGSPIAADGYGAGSRLLLVDTMRAVIRCGAATLVRDIPSASFAPWAQELAARLVHGRQLTAREPYDARLLSTALDQETPWQCELDAFRFAATGPQASGAALYPALESTHELPVFLSRDALEEAIAHCRATPGLEQGGVFAGGLVRDLSGRLSVEARHFVPALDVEASAVSIRFTRETWAGISSRRAELGAEREIVGWCHSHPPVASAEAEVDDPHFLSLTDRAIHATHFGEPYVFTVVVDPATSSLPAAEACLVYGWDPGTGIGLVPRNVHIPVLTSAGAFPGRPIGA